MKILLNLEGHRNVHLWFWFRREMLVGIVPIFNQSTQTPIIHFPMITFNGHCYFMISAEIFTTLDLRMAFDGSTWFQIQDDILY